MIKVIKKFNNLLSNSQKKKLIIIGLITLIGAFLEVLGVSLVLPITTVILEPDIIYTNYAIASICSFLGIKSHQSFVLLSLAVLIMVFIIKNIYLLFEYYARARFVYNNRLITQQQLLHAFLSRPYEFFLTSSSGEIIRNLYSDVNETYGILMTLLSFFTESVVSIALLATVFIISPLMTTLIILMVSIIVFIIIKVIKPKLKEKGNELRKYTSLSYKWLLQSIHGIKDIKIAQQESFFENEFYESGKKNTSSVKWQSVFNNAPRLLIEAGCVCSTLFVIGLLIYNGRTLEELIPALAAFAMAAVKLMPSANRIVNAANDLAFSGPAIDNVFNNLHYNQKIIYNKSYNSCSLTLKENIILDNITYAYPNTDINILENASITISSGECIGLIGKSGAGKTTTVDILLGLLSPQSGSITTDGKDIMTNYNDWLSHIGYIPQSIFILDGTIAENVVFGNDYNKDKIWQAIEDAQLSDFVKSLPNRENTRVGERGIRLSGGQLQRLGIARALYNDPELLIFDEATSSLDNETEKAIMESVNNLHGKKTMIIIAHRLQTTENCDVIYEVKNKKIIKK